MGSAREVLGIEVGDELMARWAGWFAPEVQPFLVPEGSALAELGRPGATGPAAVELRDTFEIYTPPAGMTCRGVTAAEFTALPREVRAELVRTQRAVGRRLVPSVRSWPALRDHGIRGQADGHRFVWWPELLGGREDDALVPFVEEGMRRSRHAEVPAAVWREAGRVLPGARELAGTFPGGSGPNCLATVMAASGVSEVATRWMQREPFEEWLAGHTCPGGRDDHPGTVLVWRSQAGLVQHAAVTLGAGWALHKPSQGWMSPVKVLTMAEVLLSARCPGRRLTRRRLV
ncbi:hypothetical protein [Oryzihumus sp.]